MQSAVSEIWRQCRNAEKVYAALRSLSLTSRGCVTECANTPVPWEAFGEIVVER